MIRKFASAMVCCAVFCLMARGQDTFWSSPDAYLRQSRPDDTPRVFAPGLLTEPNTFTMGRIAFSNYGKEIYYTQTDSWKVADHLRIKQVRFQNQAWQHPAVLADHFVTPTLSIDGNAMYMRSPKMDNVWQAIRIGDDWTKPALLMQRDSGLYDFMPTKSGSIYVGVSQSTINPVVRAITNSARWPSRTALLPREVSEDPSMKMALTATCMLRQMNRS